MILGVHEFLEKLSAQIDKIISMYVDPNKPYDSPKIVSTSLKTIKEIFHYEVSRLYDIIVNIEKMTRDPKSIASDVFAAMKNQFEKELQSFSSLGINASNFIGNINTRVNYLAESLSNYEILNEIENSEVIQSLFYDLRSTIFNLNSSITNIAQFLTNEYTTTNLKNEFHEEISNINNLSTTINSYMPMLLTSATVFFGVSSLCVVACTGIYCYKSYREYQLNKRKFEIREIDDASNRLLN